MLCQKGGMLKTSEYRQERGGGQDRAKKRHMIFEQPVIVKNRTRTSCVFLIRHCQQLFTNCLVVFSVLTHFKIVVVVQAVIKIHRAEVSLPMIMGSKNKRELDYSTNSTIIK